MLAPQPVLIIVDEQAIPVEVDVLGAHLQAYADLQPVLTTLRLCNRFGKGDHAVVSQLPVELINTIEGYLIDNARFRLRQDWSESFMCWKNSCSPSDHLTSEARVDGYRSLFDGYEDLRLPSDATELDDNQLSDLNEALWEVYSGSPYQDVHEDRKWDWLAKTGLPTTASRGLFSRYASLMEKHFGLELHISHTQSEKGQGGYDEDNERRSTVAYLILPGYTKFQSALNRRGERSHDGFCCEDGPHPTYCSTENGIALPLAIPNQLSKESLARFTRALKMLSLSPMSENDAKHTTMFASGGDTKSSVASVEEGEVGQNSQPQLMFIMRVNDIPCDVY